MLVVNIGLLKYYIYIAEMLLHVAGSTNQILTKLIIYLPHFFAVVCCISIWFNHPYNTCVSLIKGSCGRSFYPQSNDVHNSRILWKECGNPFLCYWNKKFCCYKWIMFMAFCNKRWKGVPFKVTCSTCWKVNIFLKCFIIHALIWSKIYK